MLYNMCSTLKIIFVRIKCVVTEGGSGSISVWRARQDRKQFKAHSILLIPFQINLVCTRTTPLQKEKVERWKKSVKERETDWPDAHGRWYLPSNSPRVSDCVGVVVYL